MGPYGCMLKEGPTPMAAYVTGTETVCLGIEVGGDEGKDVQRDAVDTNKRVPPLANVRQSGRNIPVELGDIVKGEAVKEVGVSISHYSRPRKRDDVLQRTTENSPCASAPRSERKRVEKATDPFQGRYVRSLRRRVGGVPPPDPIDFSENPRY